jgi:hypothetical protein
MTIRERFELKPSKAKINNIVVDAVNDEATLKELVTLTCEGTQSINMRAAWAMSYVFEEKPLFITPFYDLLISTLERTDIHEGVRRSILRAFQFTELPEDLSGKIITLCFAFLQDSSQPIGIKMFSMQVLYNLSLRYPEIQHELRLHIEEQFPNQSAGFKSRGGKILKKLNKQNV